MPSNYVKLQHALTWYKNQGYHVKVSLRSRQLVLEQEYLRLKEEQNKCHPI